jgi:hypothetical protein
MSKYPGNRINRPEDDLQKQQVAYLERLRAQKRLEYFAVPNGGLRPKREAAIMKGLGTRSGVPDMVILWPDARCGFIENKSEKGVTSDNQKAWAGWLTGNGHRYALIRDFGQFKQTLYEWGLISAREVR